MKLISLVKTSVIFGLLLILSFGMVSPVLACSPASGTVAEFVQPCSCAVENSANDGSGNGYDMTVNGTVNFVTSPSPSYGGTYFASNWSDSNYWALPSGLMTAMDVNTTGTIEMQINITSLSSSNMLISWSDPVYGTSAFYVDPSGPLALYDASYGNVLSGGSISTNTNYDIALTWSAAGNRCIYINNVQVASTADGGFRPHFTGSSAVIGNYKPCCTGYYVKGYISQIRFLNYQATSFPVVDTCSTPTPTFTPTNTPAGTLTPTPVVTPTATPSATPTATPTPSFSPTNTPFETATPNLTLTPAPNNGLYSKPPMGWLAFEAYGESVNTSVMETAADYITSTASGASGPYEATSMAAAGYQLMETAYWQSTTRSATGQIQANDHFPGDMIDLNAYYHSAVCSGCSQGLIGEAYTDAGIYTCGSYQYMGSYGYESINAATLAQNDANTFYNIMGFGAVDIDWCSGWWPGGINPQTEYTVWSIATWNNGSPIPLALSDSYSTQHTPQAWEPQVSNWWRVTSDIQNNWDNTIACFNAGLAANYLSGPTHWAYVGAQTAGWDTGGMTTWQNQSWTNEIAILHSPMWAYNVPNATTSDDLNILDNTEVIAADQDWGGLTFVAQDYGVPGGEVIACPSATPHTWYVLLYNWVDPGYYGGAYQNMTVNFSTLPESGPMSVRDLDTHQDKGTFTSSYSQGVSATGSVFLKIMAITTSTNTPTVTSTPTVTPTPTPTASPTPTPACLSLGILTPVGNNAIGNGIILYKQVTLNNATVQTISAYVLRGYGRMQGAVYTDYNNSPMSLVETSNLVYTASAGWTAVTFSASYLTPGKYWLAVEVTNSGAVQYSTTGGTDKFQYSQFGQWPTVATPVNYLGNASIQGFTCGY